MPYVGGGGYRSLGWFRSGPRAQKPPKKDSASPASGRDTQNGGSGSVFGDGLGRDPSTYRPVGPVPGSHTMHVQHEGVSAPVPSSHAIDSDACSSPNKAFQDVPALPGYVVGSVTRTGAHFLRKRLQKALVVAAIPVLPVETTTTV